MQAANAKMLKKKSDIPQGGTSCASSHLFGAYGLISLGTSNIPIKV